MSEAWLSVRPSGVLEDPTTNGVAQAGEACAILKAFLAASRRYPSSPPALILGPAAQVGEIDIGQLWIVLFDLPEGRPKRALALDSEAKRLELHEAAQVGVSGQLGVWFQAAHLLGQPRGCLLGRVLGRAHRSHDGFELRPVLLDLGDQVVQEIPQSGSVVVRLAPLGQLEAPKRAGEVIVQIDFEELVLRHPHPPVPSSTPFRDLSRRAAAPGPEQPAPGSPVRPDRTGIRGTDSPTSSLRY